MSSASGSLINSLPTSILGWSPSEESSDETDRGELEPEPELVDRKGRCSLLEIWSSMPGVGDASGTSTISGSSWSSTS